MNARQPYTETDLLRRLRKGEHTAFENIFNQYYDGVYNYLVRFTKNPVIAKDLSQDIFVKLWEAKERLDINTSLTAYIYKTAKNKAINQLTQISIHNSVKDDILHRISLGLQYPYLIDQLEWQQYNNLLQQAINKLPPQRREAFLLCRAEGKSYEEAAAIMNISRNTLKQHLGLAVKSIREYLKEHADISLLLLLLLQDN